MEKKAREGGRDIVDAIKGFDPERKGFDPTKTPERPGKDVDKMGIVKTRPQTHRSPRDTWRKPVERV